MGGVTGREAGPVSETAAGSPQALATPASAGFAAFRERVYGDPALQGRLAGAREPAGFVALVLAAADAEGFAVSAADIEGAMRDGHLAWLTAACEVV